MKPFNAETHAVHNIPHEVATNNNLQLSDISMSRLPVVFKILGEDSTYSDEVSKLERSWDSLKSAFIQNKNNVSISKPQQVINFVEGPLDSFNKSVGESVGAIDRKLSTGLREANAALFTNKGKDLSVVDLALLPSTLKELKTTKALAAMNSNENTALMAMTLHREGYLPMSDITKSTLNERYSSDAVASIKSITSHRDMLANQTKELMQSVDTNFYTYEKIQKRMKARS